MPRGSWQHTPRQVLYGRVGRWLCWGDVIYIILMSQRYCYEPQPLQMRNCGAIPRRWQRGVGGLAGAL